MPLPEYPRIIFRKPSIRLALAQVRFPIMLRFREGSFVAPFQETLRASYPKVAKEQQLGLQLTPKGLQPLAEESQWRFSSRDDAWSLVLAEGSLSLEVRGFSSMDIFAERFNAVLRAAVDHLGVVERSRFGLRFINEFRDPRGTSIQAWAKLLRPEFVGFVGSDLLPGEVEHAIQELRLRRSDGLLSIRHGLLSGTVVIDPRSTQNEGPFYLLDLDHYTEAEEELDIPGTINLMQTYNGTLYRIFRWAVGEGEIYEAMEPQDAN